MTKKTIDLDQHRGMAAQKATDLRRVAGRRRSQREGFAPSAGRIGSSTCRGSGRELAGSRRESARPSQSLRRVSGRSRSPRAEADCRGPRRFRTAGAKIDNGVGSAVGFVSALVLAVMALVYGSINFLICRFQPVFACFRLGSQMLRSILQSPHADRSVTGATRQASCEQG